MPPDRQLTLVTLYRKRPPELQALIDACIAEVARSCDSSFVPYRPEQIHATVIGLESDVRDGVRVHRNASADGAGCPPFDLAAFAADLQRTLQPMCIRFGGFAPDATPFMSRGLSPYERSFSIQGSAPGKAVLIGWPEDRSVPGSHPQSLDRLRQRARRFGIVHAYGADNDLYLRLGLVRDGASRRTLFEAEGRIRAALAALAPVRVTLTAADLQIVAYDDPTLPATGTVALPLVAADLSENGIAEMLGAVDESG